MIGWDNNGNVFFYYFFTCKIEPGDNNKKELELGIKWVINCAFFWVQYSTQPNLTWNLKSWTNLPKLTYLVVLVMYYIST